MKHVKCLSVAMPSKAAEEMPAGKLDPMALVKCLILGNAPSQCLFRFVVGDKEEEEA